MIQILNAPQSNISRLINRASPGVDNTIDRLLEKQKENRRLKADVEAEERKIANQKATAKALGLPEIAMDSSLQAALFKEKAKDQRNAQLLTALGLGGGETGEESTNPFLEKTARSQEMTNIKKSSGLRPEELSDEQITMASILNPQLGNVLQKQQEASRKETHKQEKDLRDQFISDREFEWKRAGDILKKTDEIRDSIQEKRTAVNLIKQTAASGDTSGWGAWFADVLGIEPLRNANSALLKSSTKDFFINNLAKAGTRPNQWIEQQISDAMVKIGRDQESNMIVADLMNYWVDREEEKIRLTDQLEDEDLAEHGYVQGNIGKRAAARMKEWEDRRRDQLIYQIQQTKEEQNPDELSVIHQMPKGTPLTRAKAKIFKQRYGKDAEQAARKAGYDVEVFTRISNA